jgi:tRNA(fMet)-specific endonuclease VapC
MVAEFIRCLDGVLPWDKDAAEQTALIRQALRQAGTPISPNDSAIAGHCLAIGATLITNNMREFGRVNGLQVEDWADQSS